VTSGALLAPGRDWIAVRTFRPTRPRLLRVALLLAAATVLAQIAYPLLSGTARDGDTVLTVLLFCAASCAAAAASDGSRWALRFLLVTAGFGFAIEALGTATGFPFGRYEYAGSLGPRLLAVPVVVPLAWAMMAYPALVVGNRIARDRSLPARIAASALALASWDVFLDPQMVGAGHWRWLGDHQIALAGVPIGNFAGWLLASAALMTLLHLLLPAPASRSDALPLGLYAWTYVSSLLANLAFFGRPAVALAGGLAMGVPMLLLSRSLSRSLSLSRA
jgi:putative membrane protein